MKAALTDALFGEGGFLKVRAILAFLFSGATVFLWVTGDPVPEELLILNTTVVTFYFAQRGAVVASSSGQ